MTLNLQNRRPVSVPSPIQTGLPEEPEWGDTLEERRARKRHEQLEGIVLAVKQQTAAAAALMPPRILFSRQDLIPARGVLEYMVAVKIAAARVQNFSGGVLYVTSGRALSAPPTVGVGVRTIAPGGTELVPVGDSCVAIWGPVGAAIAVDGFAKWPGLESHPDIIVQSTPLAGTTQNIGQPGNGYLGYALQPLSGIGAGNPSVSIAAGSSAVVNGSAQTLSGVGGNHQMAVTASAGVTGGVVQFQGSLDGTNWYIFGSDTLTAPGTTTVSSTGAASFIRAAITTAITGGTIQAVIGSTTPAELGITVTDAVSGLLLDYIDVSTSVGLSVLYGRPLIAPGGIKITNPFAVVTGSIRWA